MLGRFKARIKCADMNDSDPSATRMVDTEIEILERLGPGHYKVDIVEGTQRTPTEIEFVERIES